jgi:ABC-type nickel/cobalt efflux system permease component RcnA
LPNDEAVRLVGAPPGCTIAVHPGRKPDPVAAAELATIGADQRALPANMKSLTAGIENSADARCGGGAPGPAADAASAAAEMAGGSGNGDLTALPAANSTTEQEAAADAVPQHQSAAAEAATVATFNAGSAAQNAPQAAVTPPRRAGLFRTFMAHVVALQTAFSRELTANLKGLKSGGGFLWLGAVSFLYGIFHAAGPGHGKVVISSYLVANEARLRRGVGIAFISAFVQAVVAVAIIGLMAIVLNMTSMAITSASNVFEAGSFALVALLGVYLLAQKGRATWAAMRGGDPHAHHHHGHHHHAQHDAACGHSHLPSQAALDRPGLPGAAAAVVSVGMRPCSGALIVLVFALSQGIFWAGIAATFVMALGTAMTVAALAALAVGAKGIARRLARGSDRRGAQMLLGLELAAALLITAFGAVMFVATLYGGGSTPNI